MTEIDFGLTSADYAIHRTGFPKSFFDRLESLVPLEGVRAVDLGTGPGFVALSLADRGARAIGIDVSPNQVAAAKRLCRERGLEPACSFEVAPAEETGLEGDAFDLVIAGQCWVWFDHDRALAEAHRMLRAGGHLVVCHNCYLPQKSAVARASEALVLRHNPSWTGAGFNGLYPGQVDALAPEGGEFELVEQFCYDEDASFTHEAWRGRMRTCNAIGAGPLKTDQVRAFDADLARVLAREFPQEPLAIPHRIWAVIVRAR